MSHASLPGVLAILFLLSAAASAEAAVDLSTKEISNDAAVLSLPTAVDEALANNPNVASARADLAAATAELAIVAPWLPNPELEVRGASDALTGAKGELDVGVGVSQELPLPFARWARLDAAKARQEAARERLKAVRVSVAADVEVALVAVAAVADEMTLRSDLKDAAARLAESATQRAAAGLTSAAEANLAVIEQASSRAALADAQTRAGAARAELCRFLGRTPCNRIVAAWPEPRVVVVAADLAADALQHRSEVSAADRTIEAAQRDVSAAELDRIPAPRLGGGYSFARTVIDDPARALTDDDHLLGLTLTIPIPLWNQGGGAVARAEAARQRAAAEAQLARSEVSAQVEQAVTAKAAAADAAQAWAPMAARIDETLTWTAQGYAKGATSLQEYLATRDRLVRARLDAIVARRADIEASARLLQAAGRYPVPPDAAETQ